ncbi:MAG: IclR family transcriptional regulator [Actinomycetales bacterium]|nr:IclR family transcriptional regulator [Actinomycetales bacterium]
MSALDRALDLLDLFGPDTTALSLTELSAGSGLPLSTCHRLAATLVARGYLDRGEDRRYRVGVGLWSVAQRSPLSDRLRESALPALARLYEETGENITLAVLDGGRALYVERLMGERSIPTVSRAGARLPLHTTGVGKVLLAYQPEAAIAAHLSAPLERPTRDALADPARLRRDLAETRARGYSVTRQEMTLGSASVAVPILQAGRCVAAVGVIVHLARLDPPRLVATLSRAAAAIVAELERLD